MRRLHIDWEKCTGCQRCLLICSAVKEEVFQPSRARLHVLSAPRDGVSLPFICYQCDPAPCVEACPVEALKRDETGSVVVEHELCVGCGACETACPYGMVELTGDKAIKCDLCGGDPQCVKVCEFRALVFVEDAISDEEFRDIRGTSEAARSKREERFSSIVAKLKGFS